MFLALSECVVDEVGEFVAGPTWRVSARVMARWFGVPQRSWGTCHCGVYHRILSVKGEFGTDAGATRPWRVSSDKPD